MTKDSALNIQRGFNFDNFQRNAALENRGVPMPKATSTGTTIVGLIAKDCLVLGADTRATAGPTIADKNCEKLHYISPNIWCAGAGTAADTEFVTALTSSNVELHSMYVNRKPRVITALTLLKQHLFRYQGHIGAYLVLGGYDCQGPHLFTIAAHGSSDKLPYVALGSGSLAAISVLETKYRPDMERKEAMELVREAIEAGIFNDLGSGSNCDLVVIDEEKTTPYRGYTKPNPRLQKKQNYKFARGTTAILKEEMHKFVTVHELDEMQVDA
ncbi:20S proteasome component beta 2 [Schizosaccharomyces japonicus yFS275]|uniref:Proteasome subunit beta n=1 Tax=Schizosaccharomyces japonicus (strain yFS275 / FY16936) TaxID=402676 RepID=B6JX89_SCHJY|nr:20S proteasome component beta 2 [Schizosaccharomyces japonicus yFS275]EEB05990.1 20S proteasome component beta 2 [Schizosaccharomyces japonicus yFS275]